MADGPVVLAILDRVRKDTDGRFPVSVGLADGEACSLCFSEASARVLIAELGDALKADTPAMSAGQIRYEDTVGHKPATSNL